MTYITDRQSNWNTITEGQKLLSGEARGDDITWPNIYAEWRAGTGPERSLFEGNHPAIKISRLWKEFKRN